MPTLYDIKPAFQSWLRPAVERLAAAGATANQVTLGAAVLSVAAAVLVAVLARWPLALLILPLVLFLRMALNAVDGMLAREHGQASTLGMYLNELCDIVSDSALILCFAALAGIPPLPVVCFAIAAALVEVAGILGIPAGIGRNYAGPFGKSDRALALGLIAVLLAFSLVSPAIAGWLFIACVALSVATIVNRVRVGLVPR